jgi:CheY-like chemotaxis protein
MAKILFLDDSPFRHRDMKTNSEHFQVDYAYTANVALKFLNNHLYDLIMLDHDLQEDADVLKINADGEYVAAYMSKNMPQHRETPVVIHSLNDPGAKRMQRLLEDGGYMFIHLIPFAWQKLREREGQPVFIK